MRRQQKGISLAIETIVFIILAVTVLTVLLAFFTGTGGRSQSQIELENRRTILCGQYVRADPLCRDPAKLGSSQTDLENACRTLKTYPDCNPTQGQTLDRAKCFKQCCGLYCPR